MSAAEHPAATAALNPTTTSTAVATAAPPREGHAAARPGGAGRWIAWGAVALIIAGGAAVAFVPGLNTRARHLYESVAGGHSEAAADTAPKEPEAPVEPFRGVLRLTPMQVKALGLGLEPVKAQTEAQKLAISGKIEYDPNTLNKIRPKFRSLIDKVYVSYGQTVQQGDPLVDVFSADLAEAKGNYETKMAQWEHDRAELARSAELRKTNAISEKEHLSNVNDEKKSGTEAKIARDKLMVFGLSESDITAVFKEDGTQKAKMTLRAPAAGVVIFKDAVPGNLYDENDVLLTIGNLGHFWVYGYVYPSDASRVALGQAWVIDCPFAGQVHRAKIESITSQIDKDTKTVLIRTRVENTRGKLKADMLVGGYVEIPPPADVARTVVPRLATITADGGDYVFTLKPSAEGSTDGRMEFIRRKIRVIQEGSDEVIVAESSDRGDGTMPKHDGLEPGDKVVTRGSLILQQMYEDASSVESGAPH